MKRRTTKVLALMLAAVLALAGCAPKNDPETQAPSTAAPAKTDNGTQAVPETAAKPAEQKVLTIGTSYTIDTFVPWNYTSDGDKYILGNIYEPLFEYESGPIPELAESYTNPDDLTWNIKLREDAYWQTGNELFGDEKVQIKAEDVKFVLDWTLDPANQSKYNTNIANIISSVEALDDYNLQIKTNEPSALFLYQLSRVFIFPKKALDENFDLNAHPVGSGPFKFVEYKTDDQVVLEKNPDYYINPNLDKVVFKIIPDKSVAAIALQNGEIDITMQVLSTDVAAVGAQEDLELVPNSTGWYRYIGFNCNDPLFADVNNRKAITMAVDIDAAVTAIFKNDVGAQLAVRAYGPIPLELPGADEASWKAASYPYDPEGAKKLLEENGWKLGSDGIYEKDGKKFSFVMKTPNNDNNRMKFGTIVSTQLKQIGIDCVAQPTEWATMLSDIKAGNAQTFCMGGGSTLNGLEMLFHTTLSSSGSHQTHYDNPEVDALIEKAAVTIDPDARAKILSEASTICVKDCVHLFGYFEYVQIGMNKKVQDFSKSPSLWYSLCNSYRNVDVK